MQPKPLPDMRVDPEPVTGCYRDVASGRYRLWMQGDPSNPAILLIHGLGWDALRLWSSEMRLLAAAGWHVLAPDLLGVGQSSPLRAPRNARDMAGDLAAILQSEGIAECAVVGFSMG